MKLYKLTFIDSNGSYCFAYIEAESAKKAKVKLLAKWDVKKFYEVCEK